MRKTFSHWEFHEGKSDDMMNSRINRHNVVELQMGRSEWKRNLPHDRQTSRKRNPGLKRMSVSFIHDTNRVKLGAGSEVR